MNVVNKSQKTLCKSLIVLFLIFSLSLLASIKGVDASSTVQVTVRANPLWTDTHIQVQAGDSISISASGTWSWYAGGVIGPDGQNDPQTAYDTFMLLANKGELIAFVGPDPYQEHWGDSSFFPQSTGYLAIGSNYNFISATTGKLWLGINDDAVTKGVADNSGSLTASITIPPDNIYAEGAQCWTSTSSANPYPIQTTFVVGGTVYVNWLPFNPSTGTVDINVYPPGGTPGVTSPYCSWIAQSSGNSPLSFVPNTTGTWTVTCNGYSTTITVTPVHIFALPESTLGSLAALCACFVAFATIATLKKTKHPE